MTRRVETAPIPRQISPMPTLPPRPQPLPPERLDGLDSTDPAARAGRRDLALIDRFMGNYPWLAKQLTALGPGRGRVLELGAGEAGHLRQFAEVPGLEMAALDLVARPAGWPEGWIWQQGDLLAGNWPTARVVIASLVLHHFEPAALRRLGQQLAGAERLFFVEPARRRRHLWQGLALGPVLHPLTRHDLALSVRAGFLPGELGAALGLDPALWQIDEALTPWGALRLAACRRVA